MIAIIYKNFKLKRKNNEIAIFLTLIIFKNKFKIKSIHYCQMQYYLYCVANNNFHYNVLHINKKRMLSKTKAKQVILQIQFAIKCNEVYHIIKRAFCLCDL
jgi:plastocyanin domain-containing protein